MKQEDKLIENGIDIEEAEIMIIENEALSECLVGITPDDRAVYDIEKMAEEMSKADGMTYEEAIEYIEYNIVRSLPYYGDRAPIIYYPLNEGSGSSAN